MLIDELAQKTGLSRGTIRFYEKVGLVEAAQRKAGNAYKDYSDDTVERLLLNQSSKSFGFHALRD